MPELPDLENFANNIFTRIKGKKITSTQVYAPKCIDCDANALVTNLVGNQISSVVRNGKELYFTATNDFCFAVHLMLNGRFEYCTTDKLSAIKNKIIALTFDTRQCLAVTDWQAIAKIRTNAVPNDVPDALSPTFSYQYFSTMLAKTKRKIKAVLIDQNFVKGIGNAYADEILWTARVDGDSTANRIPPDVVSKLYDAINSVLLSAISSIARLDKDVIGGEIRSFLLIHNPQAKTDPLGNPILTRTIASKFSYYTSAQVLYV